MFDGIDLYAPCEIHQEIDTDIHLLIGKLSVAKEN